MGPHSRSKHFSESSHAARWPWHFRDLPFGVIIIHRCWNNTLLSFIGINAAVASRTTSKKIPKETMTVQQFLEHLDELVDLVCTRCNKSQVIIFGHSWGSVLGPLYAARHAEKVSMSAVVKLETGQRQKTIRTSMCWNSPRRKRILRQFNNWKRLGLHLMTLMDYVFNETGCTNWTMK